MTFQLICNSNGYFYVNIKDWTLYSIGQSREIFVLKTLKGVSLSLTKAAPTLCDKFESSAKLAIIFNSVGV